MPPTASFGSSGLLTLWSKMAHPTRWTSFATLKQSPSSSSNPQLPPYNTSASSSTAFSNSRFTHRTSSNSRNAATRKSNFRIYRPWQVINKSQNLSSSHTTFSILSYNILARSLLTKNSWLYEKCHQESLDWLYRWNNLWREINFFNCDILCMQEVEEADLHTQIKPFLESMGYVISYKRRTGPVEQTPDGVLTAVKSQIFNIHSVTPVEYSRKKEPLADRENVGLICVLESKHTGLALCVCNTHLLYNPRRGDVKLVQLCTLFAEVDRILTEYASTHEGARPAVLICGDFNSTPVSPLYHFVTNGCLDLDDLARQEISGQDNGNFQPTFLPCPFLPKVLNIDNNCRYNNISRETKPQSSSDPDRPSSSKKSRKSLEHETDDNTVISHAIGPLDSCCRPHSDGETTTTQDGGITVDYIFYTSSAASRGTSLTLHKRFGLPDRDHIKSKGSIPNPFHSSDHLPVAAYFIAHQNTVRNGNDGAVVKRDGR